MAEDVVRFSNVTHVTRLPTTEKMFLSRKILGSSAIIITRVSGKSVCSWSLQTLKFRAPSANCQLSARSSKQGSWGSVCHEAAA
jgi:hypothetical protein